MTNLREAIHQLKLNDAINRAALEKLKREKDALEKKQSELNVEKTKVLKARNLDANYLIKQEEYMADLKIALKLGDGKRSDTILMGYREYKWEIEDRELITKEEGI